MSSIHSKPSKIKTLIMLIIILATAIQFAAHSAPQPVAMKRESRITAEAPEARIIQVNLPGGYVRFMEV